jgi:hypothetical protein
MSTRSVVNHLLHDTAARLAGGYPYDTAAASEALASARLDAIADQLGAEGPRLGDQ